MWSDLIVRGLTKSNLYSNESICCVESMLSEAPHDEVNKYVLTGERLELLLSQMVGYMKIHKTELALEKGFSVLNRLLRYGDGAVAVF